MADGQNKKCEEKRFTLEEIFASINPENLHKLSKERLQHFCNVLELKVSGEKQELIQRLQPLGKCKTLFDKKFAGIRQDYKFSTALDPTSISPPSAKWKVIGKDSDVAVPIVTESTIKEYQNAKYAGGKGQYRKAVNYHENKKLYLNMSCTEKLQKWHKKATSVNKRAATQIRFKYLRNLLGARRDIKKVKAKKKVQKPNNDTSDYSDWY